ncbi:hypothetical protein JTB14_034159 [Gonioctena quinquepunctata]|nr:hypothetical protein JTB14_034159 [Gonioctena quinquepunctata]
MVQPSAYAYVRSASSAKEAWSNLEKAYEDKGLSRRLALLRSLFAVKLEKSTNMEEYVSEVMSLSQKLADINSAVDDEFIAVILLSGLPSEFNPMITALESSKQKLTSEFNPVNNDTNVPLHQVLSQESSDEVQGDMVDMVEKGESQHTERYEDHSSSENLFDSDREERRYPLRERKPKDFSNFKLYHTISGIEDDPVTVEDAMSRNDREMWKN